MRACVIIPAYNEAQRIGGLIKQICSQNIRAVVIDDGSQDNTARIAAESGATVIRNQKNLGKGAALVKGFDYALRENFDAAICMDGDGQHLASEISKFLRAAENSKSEVLVGNRMSETKGMPRARVMTNRFMSWLISRIAGQKIPDTQCGFRLIKKNALAQIKLTTSKFEIETELLIKCSRLGFKIDSVPIKTIYGRQVSQINPFIDTLRFIRYVLKELWTTKS